MHPGANTSLRELPLQRVPVLHTKDAEVVHRFAIRQLFGQLDLRDRLEQLSISYRAFASLPPTPAGAVTSRSEYSPEWRRAVRYSLNIM